MIDYIGIGQRIKLRRVEKHLTQIELAELINSSNNHISSVERGKEHPSLEFIVNVSLALDTTPDYFLLGNIHCNNLTQDIIEITRLCNDTQLEYIKKFILFISSQSENDK